MGPQVTAAILIFILLQKSSNPLQSDRSSPLLSNLVPSQSCKCSWVSSESCEQSLQPMLFTWECLKLPLTPAIALALYLIYTLTLSTLSVAHIWSSVLWWAMLVVQTWSKWRQKLVQALTRGFIVYRNIINSRNYHRIIKSCLFSLLQSLVVNIRLDHISLKSKYRWRQLTRVSVMSEKWFVTQERSVRVKMACDSYT